VLGLLEVVEGPGYDLLERSWYCDQSMSIGGISIVGFL
jgi:hypothetical protein